MVRELLAQGLGEDARSSILGHVQRGGTPSAYDRSMATTMGATAVDVFCLAVPGDEAAVRARAEEAVIAVLPEAAPPAPPEDEQTR